MIKLKSLKIKNNAWVLAGFLIAFFLFFAFVCPATVSAGDINETIEEFLEGGSESAHSVVDYGLEHTDPGTVVVHFGTAIIGGVIHLIAACTAAITVVAGYILKYATDPNFLSFMPYTSVTDNPVINAGWPITRGLSYAFIAIGIMIIGVATALRIEGYGAKKALPLLIIMAILVNFTPVICGVFVDASNLLMNFFLEDIKPSTFAKNQIALQKGIISEIGSPKFHIEMSVAVVASGVIFVIVDLLLIVIFLAYAVLFFIRHIAIWILVVLAPLAFTSYILPYTREWWKKWWHQFISWCLVGVIAGFFLYLSSHLMVAAGDLYSKSKIGVEGIEKEISDPETVIKVVFTILTVAILLMIGLFLTISGAPTGTQGILSAIKKNSIKFYKKAGKAGLGAGKFLSKKTPGIRNVAGGISNAAEGIGNIARTEQGVARRRETKIKEGEKAFEGLSQGTVERGFKNYNKSTFSSDRMRGEGIARTLLYGKNEQGQDYDLTDNAKKDIIALASNHPEYQKTVLSKRPDWAPEIEKGYKTKVPDNIRTTIIEQQMKKVGAKTLVKNIQKEAIHDKGVALNIIKQERLFKEFGKKDTSPEKIIELRHTLGEHTGEYRKEGHESLLDSRIHEMSENPSWLTKKETKKSTTDSNISLDTSKESFKKTKNQHKPGAFG